MVHLETGMNVESATLTPIRIHERCIHQSINQEGTPTTYEFNERKSIPHMIVQNHIDQSVSQSTNESINQPTN
jgi:hypothetical protein